MSSSDTIPPEVNITELYITHIDGKGYWQVSGSYEDANDLNFLNINYSMGRYFYSIEVSASDLDSDGNFSFLSEIPDYFPNGELEIWDVNYQDVNGNNGTFTYEQVVAVNALIPDATYVKNPDSSEPVNPVDPEEPVVSDAEPPLLELTEVRIEQTDSGNYFRKSENI